MDFFQILDQYLGNILRGDIEVAANSEARLKGDRAKTKLEEDKFGLENITKSIASTLSSGISADGYTLGIEANWGEGKSSLVNFVVEALASNKVVHRTIRFEPWLVKTKSDLLSALFGLLIGEIRDFGSNPRIKDKLKSEPLHIEKTLAHLSKYASALGHVESLVDYAAGFDPTLHLKPVVWLLKVLAWVVKFFKPKRYSLEQRREQVRADLQTIANLIPDARFTVIIDDLDRLEPSESVEILRLVKAVADFPMVTYVVCFDREILAKHIEQVLRIEDGASYIEKIFQGSISLPPQEPFALRRYVRSLLQAAFPQDMDSSSSTQDRREREQLFFDVWCGKFIETPRDAVRFCESVKLGWPYIKDRADFIDYIWLQLIKLRCAPLYQWVRNYVVNIGSYRDGGRPGDGEPAAEGHKLREIFKAVQWDYKYDRIGLRELLPGVSKYPTEGAEVFSLRSGELDKFENDKRLGSPSHWRYYFSFDKPSYALDDDLMAYVLRESISNVVAVIQSFKDLIARPHDKKGYYFEVFLERLFDRRSSFSPEQSIGIAKALAEVMDHVIESPSAHFSLEGPWRRALLLLDKPVSPHFDDIVRTSYSINWLATVLRDQGFALGRPDRDQARADRQWIAVQDFDSSLKSALRRFKEMGIAKILNKPEPLYMLYCWKQLGDPEELKAAIEVYCMEDASFLSFLEAMRSYVNSSSKGLYRPLRREIVEHFTSSREAGARLADLAGSAVDYLIRQRAKDLLQQWEDDD